MNCQYCDKQVNLNECVEVLELSHWNGISRVFYCDHLCQIQEIKRFAVSMLRDEATEDETPLGEYVSNYKH